MMPLALVISSHVAASRVGAKPIELALQARKIDAIVTPTTLFGRHPGWGAPGGGAVAPEILAGMLEGIEAQGLFSQLDAVATGYFANAAQVEIAADAIARVRRVRPAVRVVIDPILGDAPGGLYVQPDTAAAIARLLVPSADLIAPNIFELQWLSGHQAETIAEIVAAARGLAATALVSSVLEGADIGAVFVDRDEAWAALAPREAKAPNGTGDLLTGAFLAGLMEGLPGPQALHRAVGIAADIVRRANTWNASELPIVAAADAFVAPSAPARLTRVG